MKFIIPTKNAVNRRKTSARRKFVSQHEQYGACRSQALAQMILVYIFTEKHCEFMNKLNC